MGFDAGTATEALDYDFTTASWWARLVESHPAFADQGKGTVPEPSDDDFWNWQRANRAAFGLADDADEAEVQAHLSKMTADEAQEMNRAILESYCNFCAGSPSRELLSAIPFRFRRLFYTWLSEQVTNPKAPSDDTKPSLVALPSNGRR